MLSREKFARQLAKRGITVADVFDGYAAMVNIVMPATIARSRQQFLAEMLRNVLGEGSAR